MMLAIDSTTGDPVASSARCEVVDCHQDGWRRVTVYRGRTPDYVVVCRACHELPEVRAAMQPPTRIPIPDLEQLAAPDAMPRPRPGRASSPLLSMVEGGASASMTITTREEPNMPTHRPLQRRPIPTPDTCVVAGCKGKPYVRGVCSSCRSLATSQGLWEAVANPKKPGSPGTARAKFAPILETPPAAEPAGSRPETPLAASPDQRPKRQPMVDVVIADDWDDPDERFELTVEGRAALAEPAQEPAAAGHDDEPVYGGSPDDRAGGDIMLKADPWAAALDEIGKLVGADPAFDPESTLRNVRAKVNRVAELERDLEGCVKALTLSMAEASALQDERDHLQAKLAEAVREGGEIPAVYVLDDDCDLRLDDRFGVTDSGLAASASLRPWMRPARPDETLSREELLTVLEARLTALGVAGQLATFATASEISFRFRDDRGGVQTETLARGEPCWPWSLASDVVYAALAAACEAVGKDLERVGRGEVEVASQVPGDDVEGV